MQEWFFWVHCALHDLSHTKFSIHEATIEQVHVSLVHMVFKCPSVYPKDVEWGNMGYLIPEVAPGDWAIEILEVQILYAPMYMCPY